MTRGVLVYDTHFSRTGHNGSSENAWCHPSPAQDAEMREHFNEPFLSFSWAQPRPQSNLASMCPVSGGLVGDAQGKMVGDFCPRAVASAFGQILSVLLKYGASVHGQIVKLML